jgi:hypothetical protein
MELILWSEIYLNNERKTLPDEDSGELARDRLNWLNFRHFHYITIQKFKNLTLTEFFF